MPKTAVPKPLLLRWQGRIPSSEAMQMRLQWIAGLLLMMLLATLPMLTRTGLGLTILAAGALWIIWGCVTPAGRIGSISSWLLVFLAIALLATGFSPVPLAAAKGLIKLISYLGVYALMRQLLATRSDWWDRLVAALLIGELISSVIAIRQLYAPAEEMAHWADPNSVAAGTVRIYGPLGNPNLLAGYLIPILPLALVALLRWQGLGAKLYAMVALGLGITATLFSFSRGGWLGMLSALAVILVLLLLRSTSHWPLVWRRLLPLIVIVLGTAMLVIAATQIEPIRTRITSLIAGRSDSSNNFRINVWLSSLEMIQARPWLGIGPGNAAFNSIYPLFQQPKFNALSAYSVPLEILVETGLPGLIASLALVITSMRKGLAGLNSNNPLALPALASLAAIAGLAVHGITDTIFFRPEVQLVGWFCLATLAQTQPEQKQLQQTA
ncbi:MAG: putative bicarbonate transporter, IctB family [Prochlorococcus sp. MED-G132]|nr:MAG: putative bicarbonate transporter, IctB family [Prochlorococcus sp. MED-G132]